MNGFPQDDASLHFRTLLVKGGLDGHDRGIFLVARTLRDAGFEVIYGGRYQSPEEIVRQTIQEDPDVIGISVLSGGHMYVFRRVAELLAAEGVSFPIVGGGIIPVEDREELLRLGVRAIFDPNTNRERDIIPVFEKLGKERRMQQEDANTLWQGIESGDHRALAKFITLLTHKDADAYALAEKFHKSRARKKAHIVGFTGGGGVGKSTLLAQFVLSRPKEYALGVLFVDPPAVSGGAFLGDRIRLQSFSRPIPPRVYARSIAAHETFRGVTPQTPAIIDAMVAAGKEFVFVESMGVGQKDEGFSELVDTLIYVSSPAMGDTMQVMKGGAIETGHLIILNQCDTKGADEMFVLLNTHWGSARSGTDIRVPVLKTNALTGEGMTGLWEAVLARMAKYSISKVQGRRARNA